MPTPIVVSYSELDTIRQCGHKHDLAYRHRWVPTTTKPALNRGRLWHAVLAVHYGHIMDGSTDHARRRAVADLLMEENAHASAERLEDGDLIAWMYDGYEDVYGRDPQWEVLAIEDQRLIRLPDRNGRASRFYLRMRVDLLVTERLGPHRKLWVVDHKSGQNLPSDKELDLDDQFGLYTWGLRQLNEPVFGSLYSAARTQRNKVAPQPLDERFSRSKLYRSDRELDKIAREAWATARNAYAIPLGQAPRAPDSSPIGPSRCRAKCPFTEPCLLGRKAGDAAEREFLSAGFVQMTEAEQLAERGYVDPMMP